MNKPSVLIVDNNSLVTKSTAGALAVLIEGGLPKQHAMTKLGIHPPLAKQIDKLATTYIDYFIQGEDIYTEKIVRNTPKMQKYIEACVETYMACERAESMFAGHIVESIMSGIEENPELALKVAERRFAEDWSPKKQIDIKKESNTTIKQIVVNMDQPDPIDADFEAINE